MIALAWLALAARAQESDSRDDEIFGTTTAPPPPSVPPAPDDTQNAADLPLNEEIRTDSQIGDLLAAKDMRLTFGGMLYLRQDAAIVDGADGLEDVGLSSPSLFDLFADINPNDRLRGFVQGRLRNDWTVKEGEVDSYGEPVERTSVALDQMWLKGDIGHRVFVTAGKQRVKWGAGRFWNPTDFLNPQRLDALSVFDERMGVGLVKVHVPIGTWNAYAIADVEQAQTLEQVGGAGRLEALVGNTEITASIAARKYQPLRIGADLSTGIWLFDLHVEGALLHGGSLHGWDGTLDLATFTVPTEVDRSDEWIPQVTAGAEITFKIGDQDTLTWGVEGFYNDLGVDDPDLYPWLIVQGDFVPFYAGRQYGSTYLYLPAPGNWQHVSFTASAISNLSDETAVARLDASWVVLTELTLNAYGQYHFGDQGEFAFSLDVPPVKGVAGLENGISIPAPMLDVGVGARLEF